MSDYPYWSTSLVTAPAVEPITLTEAKLHCRVDHTSDDDLITSLIVAARMHGEAFTGRAFITQTWANRLDRFPAGDIRLVKPPVASVTSITYVDGNGATQTLSTSDYRTDLPSGAWAQPGRIEPVYGGSWPATRAVSNAVTVTCVHGYGLAVAVPDAIKSAIKLMVGHWYETREAVSVSIGANVQVVPLAVESLLSPFCIRTVV